MGHWLTKNLLTILLLLAVGIGIYACKRDIEYIPNSGIKLSFSNDTVLFDTVFTSIGSTTRRVKLYNRSAKNIRINEIFLSGRRVSGKSPFRLNINGAAQNELKNVELAAKDSMYIFVEVTINPNEANLPFLVSDSILVNVSEGTQQKILLWAHGQNAVFVEKGRLECNEMTWTRDKPYILLDTVYIPQGCNLTIEPGSKIYFHTGATLLIGGTLTAQGDPQRLILFQNDRLDPPYNSFSGVWGGLFFLSTSKNNVVKYAQILNSIDGIHVEGDLETKTYPDVQIDHCLLFNVARYGILGIAATVKGENLLVLNCGTSALGLVGGTYQFMHCSFLNISNHSDPLVVATNQKVRMINSQKDTVSYSNPLNMVLTNNLLNGTLEDEIIVAKEDPSELFNVSVQYNALQVATKNVKNFDKTNLFNQKVNFKDRQRGDFRPDSLSSICKAGVNLIPTNPSLRYDLIGVERGEKPALGCLECPR